MTAKQEVHWMTTHHLTLKSNLSDETLTKLGLLPKSPLPPDEQGDLKAATQRQGKNLAIREIIAVLRETYPQAFDFKDRKPLKIGIFHDLYEDLKPQYSKTELRKALSYYTQNYRYQKALATHDNRYDLAGRIYGEVTEEQKIRAHAKFMKLKKEYLRSQKNSPSMRRPRASIIDPFDVDHLK